MKKNLLLILTITLMLLLVTGCGKPSEDNNDNVNNPPGEKELEDTTDNTQNGMQFSNIKIDKIGATSYVRGIVENKSGKDQTLKLQLIMSNKDSKRIYGRVETTIENLKVNEKRNFEISMVGDYSNVDNFEVKIIE